LCDRVDGVLRQAILCEPHFVGKLRKVSGRIECMDRPTVAQQQ
jgi:hypothetical protein